jgi:hypothetical protein
LNARPSIQEWKQLLYLLEWLKQPGVGVAHSKSGHPVQHIDRLNSSIQLLLKAN